MSVPGEKPTARDEEIAALKRKLDALRSQVIELGCELNELRELFERYAVMERSSLLAITSYTEKHILGKTTDP